MAVFRFWIRIQGDNSGSTRSPPVVVPALLLPKEPSTAAAESRGGPWMEADLE